MLPISGGVFTFTSTPGCVHFHLACPAQPGRLTLMRGGDRGNFESSFRTMQHKSEPLVSPHSSRNLCRRRGVTGIWCVHFHLDCRMCSLSPGIPLQPLPPPQAHKNKLEMQQTRIAEVCRTTQCRRPAVHPKAGDAVLPISGVVFTFIWTPVCVHFRLSPPLAPCRGRSTSVQHLRVRSIHK